MRSLDRIERLDGPINSVVTIDAERARSEAARADDATATPLEIGSDIGGSIRIPAHNCGVVGHKPSHRIIPTYRHIPGPPGALTIPDLFVAGPLARSVDDLVLAFDLMKGPDLFGSPGSAVELPPAHRAAPAGEKGLTPYRKTIILINDVSVNR